MSPSHFIFNHIPKTGGTTLLTICRARLAASQISPHLIEPEIRLIPASRFERYALITGHFSILTQAGFCRGRYSMTLLRDPIRRIFSAYTFWRAAEESNVVTAKAKELSFADFVRYFADSPAIIHNPYTHHFAAVGRDFPGYPADETGLLDAARNNLAAFDFVGVCEKLPKSVRRLCQEAGWPAPTETPHENRSYSERGLAGIETQTLELLRERNRLDLELYEYATTRLTQSGERNRFVAYPASYAPARRAAINDVSARWVSGETLEIAVRFCVRTEIAELSLGVQVDDADGEVIWGTSTSNEGTGLQPKPYGESRGVFLVDCDLPPGLYFVTVALSEPRRLGFHEHWIDHATLFEVARSRMGTTPQAPKMTLRQLSI